MAAAATSLISSDICARWDFLACNVNRDFFQKIKRIFDEGIAVKMYSVFVSYAYVGIVGNHQVDATYTYKLSPPMPSDDRELHIALKKEVEKELADKELKSEHRQKLEIMQKALNFDFDSSIVQNCLKEWRLGWQEEHSFEYFSQKIDKSLMQGYGSLQMEKWLKAVKITFVSFDTSAPNQENSITQYVLG